MCTLLSFCRRIPLPLWVAALVFGALLAPRPAAAQSPTPLPSATVPVTAAAPVTATTAPFPAEVVTYTVLRASHPGAIVIIGLVANRSDAPVPDVAARVSFLDAHGSVLRWTRDRVARGAIPARGTWPFELRLDTPPSGYKSLRVEATPDPSIPDPSEVFFSDFQTTDVRPDPTVAGAAALRGTLKNVGAGDAAGIALYALAYDAAGRPVDVGYGLSDDWRIPAGGASPFYLRFSRLTAQPARYALFADALAYKAPPGTPTPYPTDTPTPKATPLAVDLRVSESAVYTPANGKIAAVGAVRNAGREPAANVVVRLTLLDETGQAVGTGETRLPFPLGGGYEFPFRLTVDAPAVAFTRTAFEVTQDPPASADMDAFCRSFQVFGWRTSRDPITNKIVASGLYRNDCDRPVRDVQVVFSAYDTADRLLDVAVGNTDPLALLPGEWGTFRLAFDSLSDFADYSMRAWAWFDTKRAVAPTPTPAAKMRLVVAAANRREWSIKDYRVYVKDDGRVSVIGELRLTATGHRKNLALTLKLLDAGDQPVGSGTAELPVFLTEGEDVPFIIDADPPQGPFVRAQLEVAAERDVESNRVIESLNEDVNFDLTRDPETNAYAITGTVKNTESRPVHNVCVILTFGSGHDEVLDVGIAELDRTDLDPGDEATFRVKFENLDRRPSGGYSVGYFVRGLQGAAKATPVPTRAPTVAAIKLAVAKLAPVDNGEIWLGEVTNRDKAAAAAWEVAVTLVDKKGAAVAAGRTAPSVWPLLPGEKLPFTVRLAAAPPAYATARAVARPVPAPAGVKVVRDVKVAKIAVAAAKEAQKVSAALTLRNAGAVPVDGVAVWITAYGADGAVTDIATAQLPGALRAGDLLTTTVDFPALKEVPATYNVVARGWVGALPTPPPPTATPVPPTPTPTPSPYPTPDPAATLRAEFTIDRPKDGDPRLYGEVINDSDDDLQEARVTVNLVRADGVSVFRTRSDYSGQLVPAGERLPFVLLLSGAPETGWDRAIVEVAGDKAIFGADILESHGLTVGKLTCAEVRDRAGKHLTWKITGVVNNPGQKALKVVRLTTAAYAADGHVIAVVDDQQVSLRVGPGREARFEVVFDHLVTQPVKAHILPFAAEGQ